MRWNVLYRQLFGKKIFPKSLKLNVFYFFWKFKLLDPADIAV